MRWLATVLIITSGVIAQTPPPEMVERAEALLASPVFWDGEFQPPTATVKPAELVERVLTSNDPVARYLREVAGEARVRDLREQLAAGGSGLALADPFSAMLNLVVESDAQLYTADRFSGVTLSAETRALIAEKPTGLRLKLLHRKLLEDYLGDEAPQFRHPRFTQISTKWGRREFGFSGSNAEAAFDLDTRRLSFYACSGERRRKPPIASADAEREAIRWLAEQGITLDGWTSWRRGPMGEGEYLRWQFSWTRYGPAGEWLPSVLLVEVSSGGQVSHLGLKDPPIKVDLTPRVTREEAVRIVLKAAGEPRPVVNGVLLRVWVEPYTGEQSLCWSVGLIRRRGEPTEEIIPEVLLDALTGKVLFVNEVDVAVPPGASQPSRQPCRALPWALAVAPLLAVAAALALRRRRRV